MLWETAATEKCQPRLVAAHHHPVGNIMFFGSVKGELG